LQNPVEFGSSLTTLEGNLSPPGFGIRLKDFEVNQLPGKATLGGAYPALIVLPQTGRQIGGGSDVTLS
jgi:hypothetical protein